MKIVTSPAEMKILSLTFQKAGKKVGLVPTMGALHAGHVSLLKTAQQLCDIVVMSIFVNPTQFGPAEDFKKYPRPFDEDCKKAEENWCDVVFAPSEEGMYPAGYSTYVNVEKTTDRLCGANRPGHFRGVTTVVLKFINIVMPHIAVFGQKDGQQCIVIKRMIADLNVPVKLVIAPTVRESDGLAMSSRNAYLTQDERSEAPEIFKGLKNALALYESGERDAKRLCSSVAETYRRAAGFSVEYVELVDTVTAEAVSAFSGTALLAVAVRTRESKTRLIDNIVLGGSL
jgi:pantoate--beta-alanine ligase